MQRERSTMEAVLGDVRARVPALSRLALASLALLGLALLALLLVLGFRVIAASGAFDVEQVEVRGAGRTAPAIQDAVVGAVGDTSMLHVDPHVLARRLEALPRVQSAQVDRVFPTTLRINVVPERPAAVAMAGRERVVVAASGRVLGPATDGTSGLPEIAAAPSDLPGVGGRVTAPGVVQELRVAAAARRGLRFVAIGYGADGLTARTAAGLDVRFGDAQELALKLKVARTLLRRSATGVRYIDVSVPTAPVLRQATADPLTADAPPPMASSAAASGDDAGGLGGWSPGASPAESIRTLFG